MARTVRDANLESRAARLRLKAAAKPYYRAIDVGLHIGYRRGKTAGKWVMRAYLGNEIYRVETIGSADDTLDADGVEFLNFSQAQTLARTKFVESKRIAAGLPAQGGPYTVALCIEDYLRWLEQHRKTAKDARWRALALILPTLGKIDCEKLSTKQLRDWRDAAAEAPARIRTKIGDKQLFRTAPDQDPAEARRRRRASANRVLTILKAALNHAWRDQKISSDQAWRALKPFAQADAARVRYLTVEEAKRLLNATSGSFHDLVHAALLTGCRFGELAALQAGDFNQDSGTLQIRTSKSGKGRHVVLTEEGLGFFSRLAAGQPTRSILLPTEAGTRWAKSQQSRPMTDACKAARIDPPAGFHTLRHTYASLSIMNGAPLMVIARNLGHVDTRMVEKHYGHMSSTYIADAIRAAVPRFGVEMDRKVVALETTR
ncbi:tyrosine-type recombinase/integrase [Lichenicoccus roseus]|uniref:Site-specific integrase n=1 Tax=Lichenicoccus roseus TaxID=2683649 RepID=A0A5R9J3A9_9PROT|nr:site-specific integrase [Lichenicoccus roseus]TLU71459.1 site-specific integrase [Lichenicoccus roseus]